MNVYAYYNFLRFSSIINVALKHTNISLSRTFKAIFSLIFVSITGSFPATTHDTMWYDIIWQGAYIKCARKLTDSQLISAYGAEEHKSNKKNYKQKQVMLIYIGWIDVTESMLMIRSPFCGYNLAWCVEFRGEDLPCYSSKTLPV